MPVQVSQSSMIAFFLFAAFLVFITVRGELSAYAGFFLSPAQGQGGPTSASVPSSAQDWLTLSNNTLNGAAVSGVSGNTANAGQIAEAASFLLV